MPGLPTPFEIEGTRVSVLEMVDFEEISVAYCTEVRNALLEKLPGASVDVCWRQKKLLVEVRHQGVLASKIVDLP